jgi:hypothetical protein
VHVKPIKVDELYDDYHHHHQNLQLPIPEEKMYIATCQISWQNKYNSKISRSVLNVKNEL